MAVINFNSQGLVFFSPTRLAIAATIVFLLLYNKITKIMSERKKLKKKLVYIRDKEIPCWYFVREKQGFFCEGKTLHLCG